MRRAAALAALAAGLAAALGAYAYLSGRDAPPAGLLRPDDRRLVARGERLYAEHCAACHGANLEGQPDWRTPKPDGRLPAPPHDAGGHTWHHPDRLLIELTRRGSAAVIGRGYESDMPGFAGTLDDAEIVAVLSFIKSRWPADIRRRHDEQNRRNR